MSAALDQRAERDRIKAALADPRTVARRLGLDRGAKRQAGGGLTIQCVWHNERSPSLSLFRRTDGLGALCHGCGRGGTVFDLVAAVFGLTLPRDFADVLKQAAQLAGEAPPLPAKHLAPPPEREPPPIEEVRRVLEEGRSVSGEDGLTSRWLSSRGLAPAACAPLCRALASSWPSWARCGEPPAPWAARGYSLILPVYDALGALRSVRARSVRPDATPKELPPTGCRAAGYVFANRRAVELLRVGATAPRACLLVVEGTPDYLTWASRKTPEPWAVIGLPGSGAWTPTLADRIPAGSEVLIRTDPDDAGDRYAAAISQALAGRCRVRVTDAGGRAARRAAIAAAERDGLPPPRHRGRDENDLLRAGELPLDPREGATLL